MSQQDLEIEALVSSMPDHDPGEGKEDTLRTARVDCDDDEEYDYLFKDLITRTRDMQGSLNHTQIHSQRITDDVTMSTSYHPLGW